MSENEKESRTAPFLKGIKETLSLYFIQSVYLKLYLHHDQRWFTHDVDTLLAKNLVVCFAITLIDEAIAITGTHLEIEQLAERFCQYLILDPALKSNNMGGYIEWKVDVEKVEKRIQDFNWDEFIKKEEKK